MSSDPPARRQQIGQYVALDAVCASAAGRFLGAEPRPDDRRHAV
ncbi:hypothetical protein [Halorubrum sp. N11]